MSVLGSGTLHHACYLVRDVKQAATRLSASLGIKPWGIWTLTPQQCELRGEPVQMSFRVAIAPVGNANYELVEPVSGESIYADHLQQYGPGFHHTCIAYPDIKQYKAGQAALLKQGRTLTQTASLGKLGEFCYFEMEEIGSCLELLYLTELPRPELTID